MRKTETFTHALPGFGGIYNQSWAGYQHLQTRDAEGRPDLRHLGDDYNGPGAGNSDIGMSVVAVAPGVVDAVISWNGNYGFGNHIFIKHELTPQLQEAIKKLCGVDSPILYSHYAHLKDMFVTIGQEVDITQRIATVGNTGTGAGHLHNEVRKPTGKGYESYPSSIKEDWVLDYYISPYLLAVNFNSTSQYLPPAPPELPPTTDPNKVRAFIKQAQESLDEALKLLQ